MALVSSFAGGSNGDGFIIPHPDLGLRYGFYRSIRQYLAPHNIVNSEYL